jgi:flagellar biosynthesis protein FlhF
MSDAPMTLHQVRARTVDSAMRLLVAQLGPAARVLRINRTQAPDGLWVEVSAEAQVAAADGLVCAASTRTRVSVVQPTGTGFEAVYARLSAVESEIARLRADLSRPRRRGSNASGSASRSAPLRLAKEHSGVSAVRDTWAQFGWAPGEAQAVMAAPDGGLAGFAARLRCGGPVLAGAQVLCLLGPPGAGTTTTALKLAARAKLLDRRRPAIVQLDCGRLTAVERLARLASALGCPVQTVNTGAALVRALAVLAPRYAPIIIDVTGRGVSLAQRVAAVEPLLEASAVSAELVRVAVLPADGSAAQFAAWQPALRPFAPHRLALMGLDRAGAERGLAWCTAGAAPPLAWVADGPQIPEDIQLAVPQALARRLMLAATDLVAVGEVG